MEIRAGKQTAERKNNSVTVITSVMAIVTAIDNISLWRIARLKAMT